MRVVQLSGGVSNHSKSMPDIDWSYLDSQHWRDNSSLLNFPTDDFGSTEYGHKWGNWCCATSTYGGFGEGAVNDSRQDI